MEAKTFLQNELMGTISFFLKKKWGQKLFFEK